MRRPVTAVLVCSAALILPSAASAATVCPGAGRLPAALGPQVARAATLCVLNRERAAHGLGALRLERRLTKAAQGHSADMVAHRYFAHESRSGATFSSRIKHTGWTRNRRSWTVGENIAWGSGGSATPRAIAAAWMHSAGHRANILSGRFHEIGIGIASGTPTGDRGATYSTDFGS